MLSCYYSSTIASSRPSFSQGGHSSADLEPQVEAHRPGMPFEILSNPEFLAEGTAIRDLLDPDRVIIGSPNTPSGHAAASTLRGIYKKWVSPNRIITTNLWSAELSKLVANAMLAQRISSINSISAICEKTGADIKEISRSVGLDQRLGSKYLKAGIGFGGSCLKKDILSLAYLAKSLDLPEVAEYWTSVLRINDRQRSRFVERVIRSLNGTLSGKKITILGYAFKSNTADVRESPALDVIHQLLSNIKDCPEEIAIFDPMCHPEDIESQLISSFSPSESASFAQSEVFVEVSVEAYETALEACANASAILILTDWDQFRYPPICPADLTTQHTDTDAGADVNTQAQLSSLPPDLLTLTLNNPTEMNLLALHRHFSHYSPSPSSPRPQNSSKPGSPDPDDPLGRLIVPPACSAPSCRDCERERSDDGILQEKRKLLALDWASVARKMNPKAQKWVFDGRGVVDREGMMALGFEVVGIGGREKEGS